MFRIKSQYIPMYLKIAAGEKATEIMAMIQGSDYVVHLNNGVIMHEMGTVSFPQHRLEWIPKPEGAGFLPNQYSILLLKDSNHPAISKEV